MRPSSTSFFSIVGVLTSPAPLEDRDACLPFANTGATLALTGLVAGAPGEREGGDSYILIPRSANFFR